MIKKDFFTGKITQNHYQFYQAGFIDPDYTELIMNNPEKRTYNWQDVCILIVEDDYSSYRYLEAVLRKTKATIMHAADGKMAVEMCLKQPEIDLVLMDIQLPGIDGYEATKQIKHYRRNLPVIAQTAHALEEDRGKSMRAGCDDYIAKPINKWRILEIINKHL